ncbi:MAG: hypothetical protein ACRC37_05895 [Lentisphaeria bacterium]
MERYLTTIRQIADFLGFEARSDLDNIALGIISTALVIIVVLTFMLLFTLYRRLRCSKNTVLRVKTGSMLVSNTAIREFVVHVIKQVSGVELQKVTVSSYGRKIKLKIYVVITVNCNLIELTDHICKLVDEQLFSTFGQVIRPKVKVVVKKFNAANSIVFYSSPESKLGEDEIKASDSEFCYNDNFEKTK